MAASVSATEATEEGPAHSGFWALTLGGIGVVFGDIGTSPLYAFREAVTDAAHGEPVTRAMVLGVLSLILWALFIVVTSKYVLLLLRADNAGEGGTLSLMALGQRALGRRSWFLLALGVIGASMFLGDSMITPAISVLSAVDGLKLRARTLRGAAHRLHPDRAVRGPVARHRARRLGLRPRHGGVVYDARRPRDRAHRR